MMMYTQAIVTAAARSSGRISRSVCLAVGLTALFLTPAVAQNRGELAALLERIERLERDIVALRTVVASEVPPADPMVEGPSDGETGPVSPEGAPQGLGRRNQFSSPSPAAGPAMARLLVRVDQLESELARMTGELERLQYRYERLNTTLNQFAQGRVPQAAPAQGGLERTPVPAAPLAPEADPIAPQAGPNAPAPGSVAPAGLPTTTGDVRQDYKTALDLLYTGEFELAETAFRRFIEQYPDSEFLGEAYYWIGESLYVRELFQEAAEAYLVAARDYPRNTKAADSLLKLAFAFEAMGEGDQACRALRQVLQNYPDASEPVKRSVRKARADFRCR